jgi:hypothetical protein
VTFASAIGFSPYVHEWSCSYESSFNPVIDCHGPDVGLGIGVGPGGRVGDGLALGNGLGEGLGVGEGVGVGLGVACACPDLRYASPLVANENDDNPIAPITNNMTIK